MRDFSTSFGLFGGANAEPNRVIIHRAGGEIENIDCGSFYEYKAGDWKEDYVQEGGGFGNPHERDPEMVRMNVRDELVSIERANKVYGVVIDPDTLKVDVEATRELRKEFGQRANNL